MDGELIKRLPIKWGKCTSLALLSRLPKDDKNGPTVLVGKYQTGHDNMSQINRKYENLTDSAFGAIPEGATSMSAWSQRGISHMQTADLDGNGTEEVIICRTGHWNGVTVYDGSTRKCLWGKYFGPWSRRGSYATRFMRTLALGDLTGDGKMEVAVGMLNGWVCVFDATGKAVWTRCFDTYPEAMVVHAGALVIGFSDGTVRQMDASGKTVRAAKCESPITALASRSDGLLVGDASGQVALLPW